MNNETTNRLIGKIISNEEIEQALSFYRKVDDESIDMDRLVNDLKISKKGLEIAEKIARQVIDNVLNGGV